MSKFKVGDRVVFMNAKKHETMSLCYPEVGTTGVVKKIGEPEDDVILVDWGEAEGLDFNNGTKSWWCGEEDVELRHFTNDEVWEMLKPKMNQFSLPYQNIDIFSQEIKNMIVAAYRSGYGRATKGRDFMIKPRANEKSKNNKKIDNVLKDKLIVTFYKEDNSYDVSNFAYSCDTEIHGEIVYDSEGESWLEGFDNLSNPDCEMYVAIPFSEAIEKFGDKLIKVMYCGKEPKPQVKQWAIGEYKRMLSIGNRTHAIIAFKVEDDVAAFYPEVHNPDFKALVPIRDYLKHEGVNV